MSAAASTNRIRTVLAIAALATGAGACDTLLGPEQLLEPGDPSLSELLRSPRDSVGVGGISPAGPLDLLVGDTVTLDLRIQSGSYEFVSLDTSVVHVTTYGVLTAVSPGQTIVAARSLDQQRSIASVTAVVRSRGAGSIEIDGVERDGAPVGAAGRVAGPVDVVLEVAAGDALSAEVLIGGRVACTRGVDSLRVDLGEEDDLPETVRVTCPTNTAAYDTRTGEALYPNGARSLSARLVGPRGRVLATTDGPAITLANRDTLIVDLLPEYAASDSIGGRWAGGDLGVRAFPVRYSPGAAIERVRLRYVDPEGGAHEHTLDAGAVGDTIVLAAEALAGLVDPELTFVATSLTSAGAAGPAGRSETIGYDGVAPGGTLRARRWIGADLDLQRLYDPGTEGDRGIGRVLVRLYAGTPGQTPGEIVAGGTRMRRASDLKEAAPGTYALGAEICDLVGNCRIEGGSTFGVDLGRPTLTANLPRRVVNPAENLRLSAADALSGLPAVPFEGVVFALRPGAAGLVCGPVVEGATLPGASVGGVCTPTPTGDEIVVPRSAAGYYLYRVNALDRGGNRSPLHESTVLVDGEAPEIVELDVPELKPGEAATISAELRDNLDLTRFTVRLGFPTAAGGRLLLPFGGTVAAGVGFDERLTRTASVQTRLPVVRTLTFPGTTSQPRATVLLDTLEARVSDAAGHVQRHARALPASAFGGNASTAEPFSAVTGATVIAAATTICTARCSASDPATLPVTVRVVGQSGFSPFSTAYLFVRTPDGRVERVGSTTTFGVSDTGTLRTVSYTFNYAPQAGTLGPVELFAVAVTSSGNGFVSTGLQIEHVGR